MKLRPPCISNMKITDNFLPKEIHKELLDILMGSDFPWYYQDTLTHGSKDKEAFGFNHWVSEDTHPIFSTLAADMLSALNARNVIRMRADMTILNPNSYQHKWHTDSDEPHTVCIYYVNNSDGDTLIRDNQSERGYIRVSPKANRLLTFDGKHEHTGHSPTRHKNRILINANFS